MSLPDSWIIVLLLIAPLTPIANAILLAIPALRPAAIRWIRWSLSVVCVWVGIWMLPEVANPLADYISPSKLWASFWPILAGGSLALVGTSIMRYFHVRVPSGIPASDMVIRLKQALGWLLRMSIC